MRKLLIGLGLAAAAYAAAVARPGTINYTEGDVTLDGKAVSAKSLGSAELSPGRLLETGHGKAEMLLTPGVFLRMGDQSAVRMVSPSLTDTRVDLVRGRAVLEVDMLAKENRLQIQDGGVDVHIDKKGIYSFDADQPRLAVYDGKASVQLDDHEVDVGKGKTLPLVASADRKPQKFDRNETDDLMNWSKLRSEYVAEANASSVQTVVVDNPSWWAGTGWYWNPWYSTWAFIPGSGFYDNPWGFGFYSPGYYFYNPPLYYYPQPYRGWSGGVRGPGRGPVVAGRPAPSVPSTGARGFGGAVRGPIGGGARGFGGGAPRMSSPAPMGGGSVHFGGGRR